MEMPENGHLKIALTTNSLTRVDVDFAKARRVVFYDVAHDSAEFLDSMHFSPPEKREGDKKGGGRNGGCCMVDADEALANGDPFAAKVEALQGCAILFTRGLSDFVAVRIRDQHVFPVKMEKVRDIDVVIAYLQQMMSNNPPLWLRRAMKRGTAHSAHA
jgi:nitrogen fixation protein NifX